MVSSPPRRRAADRIAVLAIGSTEYHGHFLPVETDSLIAEGISRTLAATYGMHELQPIRRSCSQEHAHLPGTESIPPEELTALVRSRIDGALAAGYDRVALVSGHGGNYLLRNEVQWGNENELRLAFFPNSEDWVEAEKAARLRTSAHEDMHAGERETSLLLHLHPERVRPGWNDPRNDHFVSDRRLLLTVGMAAYSTDGGRGGIIGMPSAATADKGAAILFSMTRSFGRHYLPALSAPDLQAAQELVRAGAAASIKSPTTSPAWPERRRPQRVISRRSMARGPS
jgi:creatinine amidohydrolase